ncbi:hypothetical protein [Nocardia sp. NPDC050710]|uniref:hypothetical protein n=1 Tax=Nocardia sp. NPDC050710 TaxID=3157220 RepID=UPI0033C1C3A6
MSPRTDTADVSAGQRTDILTPPLISHQQLSGRSSTGTLRDPTNFNDQWRRVRTALRISESITGHSFRKLLIDLGLDAGLSEVVVADQVGHANPSETSTPALPAGSRANDRRHHPGRRIPAQKVE